MSIVKTKISSGNYNDDSTNFVYCFIGYNRTGKTQKAIQIIKTWKDNNPNGKVIKFDPQNKMKDGGGNDTFLYFSEKDFYRKIYSVVQEASGETKYLPTWDKKDGCLLVLDEYKLLNPGHQLETWLATVMQFKAEWNLDIIYVCHSPRKIIPDMVTFTTHYFIFYTQVLDEVWESKITEYELCIKINNIMTAYRREFGRGKYPNFPHGILVVDEGRVKLQNISKDEYKYLSRRK